MSGFCKYYKQKKQVSYDNGVTWQDVTPAVYQKGDLYEENSTDCGYIGQLERWVNSGYTCQGYDKYYVQVKQISNDGVNWTTTSDTQIGSLIETNSTDCGYVPPTGYSAQYLTFVVQETGTFQFNQNMVFYSINNGSSWCWLPKNTNSPTWSAGQKIMWKSEITPNGGIGKFSSTGRFSVEGNVMSLLYGDNFRGQTSLSGKNHAFGLLFGSCTGLISAENLVLPATTLAYGCYASMFHNCTSLTTAPTLPATTLVDNCYSSMFYGCTSLTTAPELPATTLAEGCYYDMFRGCTSLTTTPSLPATTLTDYCYTEMFWNCTSLTTAPTLPATTLAYRCYASMFTYCTSLTSATELPATTLADECYFHMFRGCTSLTTAPTLPATTLVYRCYAGMFNGCTSLNSITCLATNISATNCTTNWVNSVAASGTFTKASSMTSWATGISGIPDGWTVQNA